MPKTLLLRDERGEHRVAIGEDGTVRVDTRPVTVVRHAGDGLLKVGDHLRPAWTAVHGTRRWVYFDGQVFLFETAQGATRPKTGGSHGTLAAPMPATVVRVQVAPGDKVKRGDTLVILEAMKMELPVRAPADGTVTGVNCRPGELVQPGVGLLDLDTSSGDGSHETP
jgi:acetyl/propionyl-CoA carboxylase alpha subunit